MSHDFRNHQKVKPIVLKTSRGNFIFKVKIISSAKTTIIFFYYQKGKDKFTFSYGRSEIFLSLTMKSLKLENYLCFFYLFCLLQIILLLIADGC